MLVHHHLTIDAPNYLLAFVAAVLLLASLVLAGLSVKVLVRGRPARSAH